MNTNTDKKSENSAKKQYVSPKIERLGKLSTLIQGSSGRNRDTFPAQGTKS